MPVVAALLLLASLALGHNCNILTIDPAQSVVVTCGDWKGGMQTYFVPSKAQWAALVALDTTVVAADSTKK